MMEPTPTHASVSSETERSTLRLRAWLQGLALVVLVAMSPKANGAGSSSKLGLASGFLDGHGHVNGQGVADLTKEEWSARWWRWACSMPASQNPLQDPFGEYAQRGDQGSVFFLAGGTGALTTRDITVRSDQRLLVPLMSSLFFGPEDGLTEPELHVKAREYAESVRSLTLVLDGQDLSVSPDGDETDVLFEGRCHWPRFLSVEMSPDNVFQTKPGLKPAVSDGYFTMLAPLTPGVHELRFSASTGKIRQEVIYRIRSLPSIIPPTVKAVAVLGPSRSITGAKVRFSQRIQAERLNDPNNYQIEIFSKLGGLGRTVKLISARPGNDAQTVTLKFAESVSLANVEALRIAIADNIRNLAGTRLDGDDDLRPGGEARIVWKIVSTRDLKIVESDGDRIALKLEGDGSLEVLIQETTTAQAKIGQVWLVDSTRKSRLVGRFMPGAQTDGRANISELVGAGKAEVESLLRHPNFRVRTLTAGARAEGF